MKTAMATISFIWFIVLIIAVIVEFYAGNIEYAILYAVFADMTDRNCDYWRDKQ